MLAGLLFPQFEIISLLQPPDLRDLQIEKVRCPEVGVDPQNKQMEGMKWTYVIDYTYQNEYMNWSTYTNILSKNHEHQEG